jgi:RNA polymerase sigma-70 factor, ECF subfamily
VSAALIAGLRAREAEAFRSLLAEHGPMLSRLARLHSPSRAVAEEVVQETWIAVLRSIDGFEGRSSLRTWLCRILINAARRRAAAEGRSLPFSALGADDDAPAVDPDRFLADGPWAGHWRSFPSDPSSVPEERLLAAEVRTHVRRAVAALREGQRAVFVLRDIEGLSGPEVCELLDLTPVHQRVLLHRARNHVRQALEELLDGGP